MIAETTIPPMAGRTWLPDIYLDEIVPAARATPNDWLYRLDDGAHRYGERNDEAWPSEPVAEGQIVGFSPRNDHPDSVLTIREDGGWSLAPEPPAGATLYLTFDFLADSPEALIGQMKDAHAFEPGTEEVRVYTWGETVPLRFTALDGPPRFVVLAAEPAAA